MDGLSGYLSIPVLTLAVILQSTLVPEARISGGMPDLVFLTVLAWGLLAGFQVGIVWAIVGGVLQDLVSSAPLGTTSLALVVVVAAASLILGQVNPRNLLYASLAALVGTPALHLLMLLVLLATGQNYPLIDTLLHITLPSAIYNLIVMIPVYRIMGAFYATARPRRVSRFE